MRTHGVKDQREAIKRVPRKQLRKVFEVCWPSIFDPVYIYIPEHVCLGIVARHQYFYKFYLAIRSVIFITARS